jgi:hypothetical protein
MSKVLPVPLTKLIAWVWVSLPQAHSRVSNINFDIWIFLEGTLYITHEKLTKFFSIAAYVKGIAWAFN